MMTKMCDECKNCVDEWAPDAIKIYGLYDSRDNTLRYIGQTRNDLYKRLLAHMDDSARNARTAWIAELKTHRIRPIIVELETVQNTDGYKLAHIWCVANDRERALIAYYRLRGADLLNGTSI